MGQPKAPKRQRWKGPLSQPITRWPESIARLVEPGLTPQELRVWIDKQVDDERYGKLLLLLRHYEIEGYRSWFELAKRLAIESVDGFSVAENPPKRRGNPGRWTKAEGAQLVSEVAALRESTNLKTSQALDEIRALNPERYAQMKRRSLRKRFDEAKKRNCQQ